MTTATFAQGTTEYTDSQPWLWPGSDIVATDNVDGVITQNIYLHPSEAGNILEQAAPGLYTISYLVDDSAGNTSATHNIAVTIA